MFPQFRLRQAGGDRVEGVLPVQAKAVAEVARDEHGVEDHRDLVAGRGGDSRAQGSTYG
jgi:hypothetical protein